jgi:hypothetical protein
VTNKNIVSTGSATPITNYSPGYTSKEFYAEAAEREEQRKKATEEELNEWKTPIEFYGLVEDESNSAISDATVEFSCNDTSANGTSYYHAQSDDNGTFSIKGITGKLLQVTVSKDGYYAYDPNGKFFYYAGQNQNFVPDAGNPVIFHLKKKGEGTDLIKVDFPPFAHIAQLKSSGAPFELDLYQGKEVSDGSGQLKLEFWRDPFDKKAKIYNWSLRLTILGGGFAATDEEFPFTAPDNGYQSQIIFDMPTNNPNWQGGVNTNYYFQLPGGKYGRMNFQFLPWNGVFTIHGFINPLGSRYLEPR